MVKIKTKPDTNDHKVTIADLNANILNLTAVVKGNSEIIKAASKNVISNSSSSSSTSYSSSSSSSKKTNEKNWAQSAGSEVWKATSTQRGYMGSTLLGGLTGLSPAVVQKMGLDKAVGSIFKSVLGGIKKKWAEAGQSSNNKKINSAIESNKNAGTNKRLDKIIGLLKTRNNAVKTEEKQKSSFLGKLLSFVGSIAGPLLKLAALGAALYGIKNAVEAIAKWLGVLPRDVAETAAPPVSGVGSGLKSHAGTQKVRLKNEKLHRDALKEYLEDPYYKKMTPQERAKARYGEVPKDAPKSYREKLANLKRTQAELYETPGITKRAALNSEVRAGQSATKLASNKITPKITEPVKYKLRDVGPKMENLAGKGLNIAANALIAYDTADRVIDDIKAGEYGKAGADTARGAGTWAGMTVGGKLGAKAGKGWWKLLTGAVGAGGGALLGKEGVEALFPEYYNQLSLEELAETEPWKVRHPYEQLYGVHPGSKAFTDKLIEDQLSGEYGHVPGWRNNQLGGFAKFMLERASKYVPGMGGEEYYWDWANGKPVWTYGVTNQFLDPQWKAYVYAQGRLGRPMPEIPKSAYQGQIGYEKAKSVVDGDYDYIYEQGKIDGEKARAKKQKEKEEAAQKSINPSLVNQMNTDIANFSTPTYGLTTDFEYPIKAADEATGTTEGIEANTRTTNDYLADILAAIENIKTETNSYMTNKNIGEQISRRMGQEEIPSTNTNFPNTLIQYGQTRGRMGGN